MKRTEIDWSKHELITEFNDSIKMWKLKKLGTVTESIAFVNVENVCLVTGDFGNFVFCREFHPSVEGYVSDEYWCEKFRIATQQESHEWDEEEIKKDLQKGLAGELKEYNYVDKELLQMEEYYRNLLNLGDVSEWEYVSYAYQEYMPPFLTAEDVPFCMKIKYKFLIVFDAFEEICNRINESEKLDEK